LQQYARKLCELGCADLEVVARYSEARLVELVEACKAYPGHQMRLLRCLDTLRWSAASERENEAKRANVKERGRRKDASRERVLDDLPAERQDRELRRARAELQEAKGQIKELEVMLEDRTRQTCFLTEQLQQVLQQAETERAKLVLQEQQHDALVQELRQQKQALEAQRPQGLNLEQSLFQSFDEGELAAQLSTKSGIIALEQLDNKETTGVFKRTDLFPDPGPPSEIEVEHGTSPVKKRRPVVPREPESTLGGTLTDLVSLQESLEKRGPLGVTLTRSPSSAQSKEEIVDLPTEMAQDPDETYADDQFEVEDEDDEGPGSVVASMAQASPIGTARSEGVSQEPSQALLSELELVSAANAAQHLAEVRCCVDASPLASPVRNSPPAPDRPFLRASLDSAVLPEGTIGRFDVDHILRCLALALQDQIILAVRDPRPHGCSWATLKQSIIYLEPKAYQELKSDCPSPAPSEGKVQHPLNDIASRRVPTTWQMYTFLRSAMVGWRLSPEVAVVTLVYIERLAEVCGLRATPDNWQRLAMTCMMLASKVWDDESYENQDFAAACPLYSVDDINTMERTCLKLLDYRVLVTGSQYAKCYFRLRVTGARDQSEMQRGGSKGGVLQPLDSVGEQRLKDRGIRKQNEWREKYHAHLEGLWAMHRDAVRNRGRLPGGPGPAMPDPDPLNWTM